MGREISQYDIPDRELLAGKAQPKQVVWTEIGEAEVTYTLFGRPTVSIVNAQRRNRSAWLLTLTVLVLAVVVWQGWLEWEKRELLSSVAPLAQPSAPVEEIAPAYSDDSIPAPAATPSLDSTPSATPAQKSAQPMPAQPNVAQSGTSAAATLNQPSQPKPFRRPVPKQQAAPAVTTPPAAKPAENSPLAIVPPLTRESATPPSAAPLKVQP